MLEDGVGADRSWNEGLQKGMKTLGGDGYVHYLDCGLLPIQEGCLWPSESTVSGNGIPEVSPSAAYPPSLSQVMEGDSLRPLRPRPLRGRPSAQ